MVYLPKISFNELSAEIKVDDYVQFFGIKFCEYKTDKTQSYARAESVDVYG